MDNIDFYTFLILILISCKTTFGYSGVKCLRCTRSMDGDNCVHVNRMDKLEEKSCKTGENYCIVRKL